MTIEEHVDPSINGKRFILTVGAEEIAYLQTAIHDELVRTVAGAIAERFLWDHGQRILKMLDPQAIANLAVAKAGHRIAGEIHTGAEGLDRQFERLAHSIHAVATATRNAPRAKRWWNR